MSNATAVMVYAEADILTVRIRSLMDSDWAFIKESWVLSLAKEQRHAPAKGWYDRVHMRVERLRERGAVFSVACSPEETTQILGWACYELPVIHYVYVKPPFREQGIGRQLLIPFAAQHTLLCSDWTPILNKVANRHPNLLRKILPC